MSQVRAKILTEAQWQPFIPGCQIVESAPHEHLNPATFSSLLKLMAANRQWQSSKPKHSSSLDFDVNEPAIPDGFIIADVDVKTAPNMIRHLVFPTIRQLELLALAKCSYGNGTFCLVRALSPVYFRFTLLWDREKIWVPSSCVRCDVWEGEGRLWRNNLQQLRIPIR